MYLVGWLCFLTLEKWPFIRYILCIPAAHSPLVTRSICSWGAPYMGCMDPFFCGRLTTVGGLVGLAGPQSGCQALSCVKAAGWWGRVMRQLAAVPWGGGPRSQGKCWLTGGWSQGAGDPGAGAHSLVGEARSWG